MGVRPDQPITNLVLTAAAGLTAIPGAKVIPENVILVLFKVSIKGRKLLTEDCEFLPQFRALYIADPGPAG
jgi:hypothetical protein